MAIALLDASGDPRVAKAADSSGLTFAYRRAGPDAGQAAAIAEGWEATDGEVLFWLNTDDRLYPDTLARAAEAFAQVPHADVVYGVSDMIDGTGAPKRTHDQVAELSDLILRSNIISQPSCFVRREAVKAVGGLDESLHFVMDWDLWIRLYRNGARFEFRRSIRSGVFMGSGTKTSSISARRLGEIHALVRRNTGPWAALKSTASSLVHTLICRARP